MEIPSNHLLVTKTNPEGIITYCSQGFLNFSGYTEKALLGKPNSLLHHPNMPAGFYFLLWDTLKKGHEFNGFFEYKTKSGNSYWAFTNILLVRSIQNQLLGYTCVKRRANEAGITLFSMYYEQMRELEVRLNGEQANQQSSQLLLDILANTGDSYEACVFKLQFS